MLLRGICLSAVLLPLFAQTPQPAWRGGTQPIYRVNVVERTTPAFNYGHLTQPTKIAFRGTPLLAQARGEATVDAKRGAVLIDAHFDNVPPPSRFGAGYLTYVVWAISPEGRAQNLGELVVNGGNKGHLTASTAMQAFALIVTAEPYFAVSQPSDVVVMENRPRIDTVAKVEQVNATYELLPRKEYTWNLYNQSGYSPEGGRRVSMPEYEAITARYQAQNAIQIALAAGAQHYAPERIDRAQQLLASADRLSAKEFSNDVVATAREAAQTAEDARVISVRHAQEESVAAERMQKERFQHEAEQSRAEAQLQAERAQLQAERAQLEAERAAMTPRRPPIQAEVPDYNSSADRLRAPLPDDRVVRTNRAQLTQYLRGYFHTIDTPRGVVVIIPGSMLESTAGAERVRMRLASLRSTLASYRGLRFEVDGYSDTPVRAASAEILAERVRAMLAAEGVPAGLISVHGYGASRPLASNATAAGREENRRVEIAITGAAIGDTPVWDHAYSIRP